MQMTRTVRGSLCRPSIRTSSHHAIAMTIDQCAHRVLLLIARLSAGRGGPPVTSGTENFRGGLGCSRGAIGIAQSGCKRPAGKVWMPRSVERCILCPV